MNDIQITYGGRVTPEYSPGEVRAARNRIMTKRMKSFSPENQELTRKMFNIKDKIYEL